MSWPSDVRSLTWAQLPAASTVPPGTRAWCSDYPGPSGGVEVVSNGVRWRPTSQQHMIMNYKNGATGLVVASGAAEALFGVARLLRGGMLTSDDHLRMTGYIDVAAASDSGAKYLRVRNAALEANLLTGSQAISFSNTSTSNTGFILDKSCVILSNTAGKMAATTQPGASVQNAQLVSSAFADLSADSYIQFTIANASSQAITVYGAALFVEYGS